MLEKIRQSITEQIVDDEKRKVVQFNVAYILFFSIAAVMSIVNFFTGNTLLLFGTLTFSVLCMFDFALSRFNRRAAAVANILFSIEIVALFVFFLVTGMPEGFSAIWICMLPSFGMLLYRRSRTTVICAVMFAILVFFFWIPYGRSLLLYDYTETFMFRFPLLYVGFYIISLSIETFRLYTQRELTRYQTRYAQLYSNDELTGLFNRRGFVNEVNKMISEGKKKDCALILVDIDHFTDINGTYGHVKGDLVLKEISKMIRNSFGNIPASRWGDDKFALFCSNGALNEKKIKDFVISCSEHEFDKDGSKFRISVSVGGAYATTEMKAEEIFKQANRCLYKAKTDGRNTARFVHL